MSAKRKTRAELEAEIAALKSQVEFWQKAHGLALGALKEAAKAPYVPYVPYVPPVNPAPVQPDPFPWWQPLITWCNGNATTELPAQTLNAPVNTFSVIKVSS